MTKFYTERSNCVRAARKALGKTAKQGVDFEVEPKDGGFTWRTIATMAMPSTPKPVAKVEPVEDEAPAVSDAEAMDAGQANDPPAVLDQPDDFAAPQPLADDFNDDVAGGAALEGPAAEEAPGNGQKAAAEAPAAVEGIDPALAALGLSAGGLADIFGHAAAKVEAAKVAKAAKPAAKRAAKPAAAPKVTAISTIEEAAKAGEVRLLEIKSQANFTYQKRADSLFKMATAGQRDAIIMLKISGTNTYAKLLRRYQTALVVALDTVAGQKQPNASE